MDADVLGAVEGATTTHRGDNRPPSARIESGGARVGPKLLGGWVGPNLPVQIDRFLMSRVGTSRKRP